MLQIGNARTIYLNLFSVPLSPSGGHKCRVFLVTYSIENKFVCLLPVSRITRNTSLFSLFKEGSPFIEKRSPKFPQKWLRSGHTLCVCVWEGFSFDNIFHWLRVKQARMCNSCGFDWYDRLINNLIILILIIHH